MPLALSFFKDWKKKKGKKKTCHNERALISNIDDSLFLKRFICNNIIYTNYII